MCLPFCVGLASSHEMIRYCRDKKTCLSVCNEDLMSLHRPLVLGIIQVCSCFSVGTFKYIVEDDLFEDYLVKDDHSYMCGPPFFPGIIR